MSSNFDGGLEGQQQQRFWAQMVEKEAFKRCIYRQRADGRIAKSDSVPVLGSTHGSCLSAQVPIKDHGLIYPGLHDLHRKAVRKVGPSTVDGVRLPLVNVSPLAPLELGSSWFCRSSGGQRPTDVESAVTITSSCLPHTVVSALAASAVSNDWSDVPEEAAASSTGVLATTQGTSRRGSGAERLASRAVTKSSRSLH